jgi:hypothetical protein
MEPTTYYPAMLELVDEPFVSIKTATSEQFSEALTLVRKKRDVLNERMKAIRTYQEHRDD